MAYTTDQKVVNVGGLKTFWNTLKNLLDAKVSKNNMRWNLLFQNMYGHGGDTQHTFSSNEDYKEALIVFWVVGSVITQRIVPLDVDFASYQHSNSMYEDSVMNSTRDIGSYSYNFNTRVLSAASKEDGIACSVFVR